MAFYSNTILVGDTLTREDSTGTESAILPDYFSLNLPELYDWIDECDDDWFTYIRVDFNDTLPRLAYEAYGNATYWDIIMLVNQKTPFNCLPFDDDTIKSMATNKASKYKDDVYGNTLDSTSYTNLYNTYLAELEADNDDRFIIKIVKPSYIQEFLQLGYEEGMF